MFGDEVNGWFSDVLDVECRLVTMPETTRRRIPPEFAVNPGEDHVSFADGYPFLLIGEASLAEVNARLETPVPMNRFRPNLVVSGSEAFAEDSWKKIRIGETVFHLVKPCARCVLTTVDQATGVKDGKEPLKTLASFRTFDGKVLFGQNLIAENPGGVVRVGDEVEVLETGGGVASDYYLEPAGKASLSAHRAALAARVPFEAAARLNCQFQSSFPVRRR